MTVERVLVLTQVSDGISLALRTCMELGLADPEIAHMHRMLVEWRLLIDGQISRLSGVA